MELFQPNGISLNAWGRRSSQGCWHIALYGARHSDSLRKNCPYSPPSTRDPQSSALSPVSFPPQQALIKTGRESQDRSKEGPPLPQQLIRQLQAKSR